MVPWREQVREFVFAETFSMLRPSALSTIEHVARRATGWAQHRTPIYKAQPKLRSLCTADSFYGPGGLSARQIMSKLHEVHARDAGLTKEEAREVGRVTADARAAASSARPAGSPSADGTIPRAELEAMSVTKLVSLLVARGVDFSDCAERQMLIDRALLHLGEREKVPSVARHHPVYQARPVQLKGVAVDRSRAKA